MRTLRDSKRALSKQSISLPLSLSVGALRGELRGTAPLLETMKARSYEYSETGSNTDFGPLSDCKYQNIVL